MLTFLLNPIETTLLLSVAALYIVHCPFNKVEESFNTQAVHDFVNIFPNHLPSLKNFSSESTGQFKEVAIRDHLPWDHTQFPGAVPRTFVGSLIIGLPMRIAKLFVIRGFMADSSNIKDDHDLTAQFLLQIGSRLTLASFLVISLESLLKAIHKRYGLAFRLCFLVISISQFHYFFYAGRFIPNTYAAILANLVFASWITRQYSKSILFIAFCVVIFRFDTAIFFGWLLFDAVFIRRILPFGKVLAVGLPAGFFAIMISFIVDSIFWAMPVWPEFESLYFNVWLNKSHEWGVEPYFWYVYNCIPRLMLTSVLLPLVGYNRFTREYLIPILLFIATYSFLPHKELRFILFVTPLLNLCAASGLMNVYHYLNKIFLYLKPINGKPKLSPERGKIPDKTYSSVQHSNFARFIFAIIIVGMFSANLMASFILTRISSHNYPGGHAAISLGVNKELLEAARKSLDSNTIGIRDLRSSAAVYVDNLAAQTGLSRFVQVNGVYYSKTPKLDASSFRLPYKLIYLILEPHEVTDYLTKYCPSSRELLDGAAAKWRRYNNEIKCTLPNQVEMSCSMLETIETFKSVNIAGLLRQIRQINSIETIKKIFQDDSSFIRTRVALHTIRCSTGD